MKFIFSLLIALMFLNQGIAQTVDEIIAKFETASGGREKLLAVNSIQLESVLKMNIMGQALEINLNTVKENGKLFRRDMSGIMGMGSSYILITDTAGYAFMPSVPSFGGSAGSASMLQKMMADELAGQQFEMDCAGAFGPLVNFAAKGYQAELLGTEKVNKQECYKIKLTLKNNQSIQYLISSKDYTVLQVNAVGDMAANLSGFASIMKMFGNDRGKNMRTSISYRNYTITDGILFPMTHMISMGPIETVVENKSLQINQPIDKMFYKVSK
jgi:outer membrane lipoprotein-sorting protein